MELVAMPIYTDILNLLVQSTKTKQIGRENDNKTTVFGLHLALPLNI